MWIWNVYGKMQDGEKLTPSEEAILSSVLNSPMVERDKAIVKRDVRIYEKHYGKMRDETEDEMYPEQHQARETDKLVRLTMMGVLGGLVSLFGMSPIIRQTREYERQTQENLRYLGKDYVVREKIHKEDSIARLNSLEYLALHEMNNIVNARIMGDEKLEREHLSRFGEINVLIEKERKAKE